MICLQHAQEVPVSASLSLAPSYALTECWMLIHEFVDASFGRIYNQ